MTMSDNRIVYVVTEGEYSDYTICGVYDSRDKAAAMVAAGHGEKVKEYVLNQGYDLMERGVQLWCVMFRYDSADIMLMYESWTESTPIGTIHEQPPTPGADNIWDERGHLTITVAARDKEHAAKIAMEKRTAYLLKKDLQP